MQRISQVPPRLLTVSLIAAYLSDHYESRGIATALILLLAIAGFALFLGTFSVLESGILMLGVIQAPNIYTHHTGRCT